MSKGRTLILVNFFSLLAWWLILTLTGSRDGLGNTFFNLGMGLYAFALSLATAVSTHNYPVIILQKTPVTMIALGMVLFGFGTMLWFYYDFVRGIETAFPSFSDVLYVIQYPIYVFGIIQLSEKRMDARVVFSNLLKSVIFAAIFGGLMYVVVSLLFHQSDLKTYLLYYYMVESFSMMMLSTYIYVTRAADWGKTVAMSFVYIILGQAAWFVGDCFFFYGIVTNTLFNVNYSDLLYLTGVFLVLFGSTAIVEGSAEEGFFSPIGPVYFQKTSVYNAIDLHLRRLSVWLLSKQPRGVGNVPNRANTHVFPV